MRVLRLEPRYEESLPKCGGAGTRDWLVRKANKSSAHTMRRNHESQRRSRAVCSFDARPMSYSKPAATTRPDALLSIFDATFPCVSSIVSSKTSFFFFLNDPAPPEISPLPLHDPLPISPTMLPPPEPDRSPERGEIHQLDLGPVLDLRQAGKTRTRRSRPTRLDHNPQRAARLIDRTEIGRAHV